MFVLLFKNELRNYILSYRFVCGFALLFSLGFISSILLSADVATRKQELVVQEQTFQDSLDSITQSAAWEMLESQHPVEDLEVFWRVSPGTTKESFFDNVLDYLNKPFGLDKISQIVLSLFAVFLTFDAISGKRERGILRSLHASSLPRWMLLITNWIAAVLVASISLLFTLVASLLLVITMGTIELNAELLLPLVLYWAASTLYVGFFTSLGLLVSAVSRHSATAVLFMVFSWALFVFLIPNTAPLIASRLSPIPPDLPAYNKIYREAELLQEQIARPAYEKLEQEFGLPQDSVEAILRGDTDEIDIEPAMQGRLEKRWLEIRKDLIKQINEFLFSRYDTLKSERERKMGVQRDLMNIIALTSPTTSLTFILAEISGQTVGVANLLDEQVDNYFAQVVRPEIARIKNQSPETEAQMLELNLSGLPKFRFTPESVLVRIERSLPNFAHLSIFALVTLLLAVIAYNRYDIR